MGDGPVLVTGVAGFLGSHVAETFCAMGREVRGIDNMLGGFKENVPDDVEFLVADCRDVADYAALLSGVELVYNCAAAPYEGVSVFSPYFVHEHTCSATIAVLSASVQAGVKRFVQCSSMARYGAGRTPYTENMVPMPADPYGIAKLAAEQTVRSICDAHGVEYQIAVPHNIIGPRQRYDDPYRNVAAIMINRMLRGLPPIVYGDGSQRRCFSFVSDVVSCLVRMGTDDDLNGEVINVGPDEDPVTILELAHTIADILGMPCEPVFVPGRPLEVPHAVCSSDKARRLLGYRTTVSLRDGLTEMADWIAAQGTREFDYRLPLEIVNELTPATWTKQLI
ncbi:MAG: NAD-dependent epimerase/dehydratase family protein [Kribbellaceae bacterium]|nr:NAD-dependent epimerase/dehydratase family protein [Kribbellaceae bacterium]